MHDALTWFQIATSDIARANRFYSQVLGQPLIQHQGPECMWIFPYDEPRVGGALIHRPQHKPGEGGTIVYLRVAGPVTAAAARVQPAGGEVILPAFQVPGVPGHIALIRDTEGNHVGLHGE